MDTPLQLPLPFRHADLYHPADFLVGGCNAAALAWLDAPWPGGRLAIWGGAGAGKTHLLHVWCARTGAALIRGAALVGLPAIPPDGLAVDDADRAPERPLLHLLNAAAEQGRPVLLAAPAPPSRWSTALPDLASRLRATPAVELSAPDDAMLATLFSSLLAARQLAVPEHLQRYMLRRLPRDPASLRAAAARLDELALAAGCKVTQIIAEMVIRDLEQPMPPQDCTG